MSANALITPSDPVVDRAVSSGIVMLAELVLFYVDRYIGSAQGGRYPRHRARGGSRPCGLRGSVLQL